MEGRLLARLDLKQRWPGLPESAELPDSCWESNLRTKRQNRTQWLDAGSGWIEKMSWAVDGEGRGGRERSENYKRRQARSPRSSLQKAEVRPGLPGKARERRGRPTASWDSHGAQ